MPEQKNQETTTQKSGATLATKVRRSVIALAIIMLITLVLLELLLRLTDPLGADAYFYDMNHLFTSHTIYTRNNEHTYLPDGNYEFRHWTATVADGVRISPDTPDDADCHIAVMGDSVTFGYAVNDEDTWVNQLAKQNPQVRFENHGSTGYNSHNVRIRITETAADAYLYLLFENDSDFPMGLYTHLTGYKATLTAYLHLLKIQSNPSSVPTDTTGLPEWFLEDISFFNAQDNLLVFGFDDAMTALIKEQLDLIVIPDFQDNISVADQHPTVAEHINIANNMQPYVEAFIAEVCDNAE